MIAGDMERIPISERIKEVSSISEAAGRLSVSRPSLYKYMEYYDRGDYDPIPPRILSFFDMVESDDGKGDNLERRLIEENLRSDRLKLRIMGDAHDEASVERPRYAWTVDEVPTMLVVDRDGASVIFRNAVAGGWDAIAHVSVIVDGVPSEVRRYEAGNGSGIVRMDRLPAGPRYQYTAELRRGGEIRTSEPHLFSLR